MQILGTKSIPIVVIKFIAQKDIVPVSTSTSMCYLKLSTVLSSVVEEIFKNGK